MNVPLKAWFGAFVGALIYASVYAHLMGYSRGDAVYMLVFFASVITSFVVLIVLSMPSFRHWPALKKVALITFWFPCLTLLLAAAGNLPPLLTIVQDIVSWAGLGAFTAGGFVIGQMGWPKLVKPRRSDD